MIRSLFRGRKYRTGTGWCLWRWTDVDSEYITRLHVLKTPWFAVCLHWINKPDPEPYLHDHPVSFLSVILRGWYSEYRRVGGLDYPPLHRWFRRHRWFNFIHATPNDRHTIYEVSPGGAVTLCFMGPKTREWGFHKYDGSWESWRDYYTRQRAKAAANQMESK